MKSIHLPLDSNKWCTLVNTAMNLWVPRNMGNFLTRWRPISFSSRICLHGVSLLLKDSQFLPEHLVVKCCTENQQSNRIETSHMKHNVAPWFHSEMSRVFTCSHTSCPGIWIWNIQWQTTNTLWENKCIAWNQIPVFHITSKSSNATFCIVIMINIYSNILK